MAVTLDVGGDITTIAMKVPHPNIYISVRNVLCRSTLTQVVLNAVPLVEIISVEENNYYKYCP